MEKNKVEKSVLFQGFSSVPMRIGELKPPLDPAVKLSKSADVLASIKDLRRLDRETFIALHVDAKNVITMREVLFVGTIDSSAVYPREVLKSAVMNNSSSIIIAHNHPSGDCSPSEADRQITRDIQAVLLLSQIRLLDHVIVGSGDKFLSFADTGWIADDEAFLTLKLGNMGLLGNNKGKSNE